MKNGMRDVWAGVGLNRQLGIALSRLHIMFLFGFFFTEIPIVTCMHNTDKHAREITCFERPLVLTDHIIIYQLGC